MTGGPVTFDADVLPGIRRAAEAAYPHEGCGALLGRRDGGPRVTEAVSLPNAETKTPRVRFEVSPRDFMSVEREAEDHGLELLGFWHSHPDHPARPSPTDREYAWEGLLTVIVSVRQGEARDLGAWSVAGPEAPFTALGIRERGRDGALRPATIGSRKEGASCP